MPHASLKADVTTRVWRHRSRGGRIVRDCAAVLAAFAILAAVIGWNHLPPQPIATRDVLAAGASPAAQEHSTPFIERGTFAVSAAFPLPQLEGGPLAGPTDRILVVATLATVFSAIVAFNVWFLRHLGRVYAFPRPGGGPMGSGGASRPLLIDATNARSRVFASIPGWVCAVAQAPYIARVCRVSAYPVKTF